MKKSVLFTLVAFFGVSASANRSGNFPQSGNVSFGGIQVKVTMDALKGYFQIGESKFYATAMVRPNDYSHRFSMANEHLTMVGSARVGINTETETLTATLFLDGGDGGNIEGFQEYKCTDARLTIVRVSDKGKRTIVKNECVFLD